MDGMSEDLGRYARQVRLPAMGEEGQRRLRAGHALIVGCGALGSACAELLARAGVGTLTLVDRDVVELTNLQRQLLFDEEDARRGLPKVEAAKARIAEINGDVRVRAFYDEFGPHNAERYAEGADVIVDGLDNLQTRYLLNDLAVLRSMPYLYGAAVGTEGMCAAIIPGAGEGGEQPTPCLRCLFPELPPAGSIATCETAGVLGPITTLVAALEVAQAIKLLIGARRDVDAGLLSIDLWRNAWRRIGTGAGRDPDCVCCARRNFEFLDGSRIPEVTVICGKNAVQILPGRDAPPIDLDAIAIRLREHNACRRDAHSFSCQLRTVTSPEGHPVRLAVFEDGRVVVHGSREPDFARSVVATYVGG